MKIKNLILPLLALLVAVGGAFATQSVNKTAPTGVWFLDNEDDQESCTPADVNLTPCEEEADLECIKQVPTTQGFQNRVIYEDSECTDPYERSMTP